MARVPASHSVQHAGDQHLRCAAQPWTFQTGPHRVWVSAGSTHSPESCDPPQAGHRQGVRYTAINITYWSKIWRPKLPTLIFNISTIKNIQWDGYDLGFELWRNLVIKLKSIKFLFQHFYFALSDNINFRWTEIPTLSENTLAFNFREEENNWLARQTRRQGCYQQTEHTSHLLLIYFHFTGWRKHIATEGLK